LLDQEQFEHKLDQILRGKRCSSNAHTLNTLPDLSITGAIRPAGRSERPAVTRPAPINDKPAPPAGAPGRKGAIGSVEGVLTRLAAAFDRVASSRPYKPRGSFTRSLHRALDAGEDAPAPADRSRTP